MATSLLDDVSTAINTMAASHLFQVIGKLNVCMPLLSFVFFSGGEYCNFTGKDLKTTELHPPCSQRPLILLPFIARLKHSMRDNMQRAIAGNRKRSRNKLLYEEVVFAESGI